MIKIIKNILNFICCCCLSFSTWGQSTYTIKRNGYLINFGIYGWFFQPCDEQQSIYEALNPSSFSIQYGTDGYNDPLRIFERDFLDKMQKDTVFYKYSKDNGDFVGEMKYKYVQMRYERDVHNNVTENIPLCMIELSLPTNDKRIYKLGCIWSRIIIQDIEVSNR